MVATAPVAPVVRTPRAFAKGVQVRAGLLNLDPEPEPPTPAAPAAVPCWDCQGTGRDHITDARGEWRTVACLACEGSGIALAEDAGADAAPDHEPVAPGSRTRRRPPPPSPTPSTAPAAAAAPS